MKNTYAERRLPSEDVRLFREVEAKLRRVRIDDSISCHVVATAVRDVWPILKMKSGRFMESWQHSWLMTPNDNIIDVYPIACVGGPLLIDGQAGPFALFSQIYVETQQAWIIEPVTLQSIVRQLT